MLRVAFALVAFIAAAGLAADDAAAQALDGRIKTIVGTKKIKIAHRVDSTPFSFVNDRKQPTGYTVDICKSVVASLERQFKVTGIEIQWVPVTSQSRFDVVAKGQGRHGVRREHGDALAHEAGRFLQLCVRGIDRGGGQGQLRHQRASSDLAGKRVTVVAGTSNEQAIDARSKQTPMTHHPRQGSRRGDRHAGKRQGRRLRERQAAAGRRPFTDPKSMRLLPDDLSIEPYAIVLPRGDWAMRLAVNTGAGAHFPQRRDRIHLQDLVRTDRLAAGRPAQRVVLAQRAGRLTQARQFGEPHPETRHHFIEPEETPCVPDLP